MNNMPAKSGTLVDVLEDLKAVGYSNSFAFNNGALRCLESENRYPADQLSVRAIYRFEGASNPNDATVVYALRAQDGTCGVFTDAFGPEGDAKASAFLASVADEREGRDESEALNDISSQT